MKYRLIAVICAFIAPANLVSVNLYDILPTADTTIDMAELIPPAVLTLTAAYKATKTYAKLKDANPTLILAGVAAPFVSVTAAFVAARIASPLLDRQFPFHGDMTNRATEIIAFGIGTAGIVGPILLGDHETGLGSSIGGLILTTAISPTKLIYNTATNGLVHAGRSLLNTLGVAGIEQEEPIQDPLEN